MKNILVPTDFSVQSLNIVHEIVRSYPQEKVNIYLIHMVEISDDIYELLFSRKSHLMAEVPEKFSEAIQLLKNKYHAQIGRMGFEFYYGNRANVLNSIVENRRIDEVCILANYKYSAPFKKSVNMIALLDRCKAPVKKLQVKGKVLIQGEANQLSSLLMEDNNLKAKETTQNVRYF